jgi:hypothetical protein
MNPPYDQSDPTEEHDERSLELRRVDAESQSSHENWILQCARLISERNVLENRIRKLREEIGLPHVMAFRTFITKTKPEEADDLVRMIVVHACDQNDVMTEFVRRIEDLANLVSEIAPDRERINRRCWALTHAAMALRDALKLKPDTIA